MSYRIGIRNCEGGSAVLGVDMDRREFKVVSRILTALQKIGASRFACWEVIRINHLVEFIGDLYVDAIMQCPGPASI